MTLPRIGVGLISWNGINFTRGRSKLLPLTLSAATTKSIVAGAGLKVDRLGNSAAPLELNISYEYIMLPNTAFTDVQAEWDALYQKFLTSPVGTLLTFGAGNYSDHISGTARLENLVENDGAESYKRCTLTFFCEVSPVG